MEDEYCNACDALIWFLSLRYFFARESLIGNMHNPLRKEREPILPPEKRSRLPGDLASSDLADKFLARIPTILLGE